MIWRWRWLDAWRTLRNRCIGCGSAEHVICWRIQPDPTEAENH